MKTETKVAKINRILNKYRDGRPVGEADTVAIAEAILGKPVKLGEALYQCEGGRKYLRLVRMPVAEKDLH